ncbi:hypothetical protein ACX928_03030 [Enterobacter roggenkampii]|uniref:hypothetical protein n=1 Tax=Enterobacteriaceae TaxID=543 RepID=UPI000B514587|nr:MULTISPECIES: hypothetical protein [Enterobacteriaceae]ASD60004.1 hypothetical protein WM95_16145 [Enterobacter cloacae complex sp. ECNIH7]MCM6991724.1 hypothetical protein [Enterobacter roggenkampii]POV42522.1 hypothetical protein C3394_03925 [Enterobacter cloacae complex sp. ECNIH11]POV46069.1 hypothetical protein C3397_03835 [Enterobacter cloacae complex sp. ECNIH16]UNM47024.1 hypothetical protein B7D33_17490 [Klebsiella pneumoniae]
MNEKVFGAKAIWTPKVFALVYLVIGIFLVFSVVSMNFTAITISVVSALLLRVLYEFLMTSFKATEHLYRIAESLDRNGPSDK